MSTPDDKQQLQSVLADLESALAFCESHNLFVTDLRTARFTVKSMLALSASSAERQEVEREDHYSSVLEDVLHELVVLKNMKDGFGVEPFGDHNNAAALADYKRRKPLAWQRARDVLQGLVPNAETPQYEPHVKDGKVVGYSQINKPAPVSHVEAQARANLPSGANTAASDGVAAAPLPAASAPSSKKQSEVEDPAVHGFTMRDAIKDGLPPSTALVLYDHYYALWASTRSANMPTGAHKRFAAKCRPSVAHYMRTMERSAMSPALSATAKEAAEKEAARLGRLLDEIDAMCPSPEQPSGNSESRADDPNQWPQADDGK